MNTKNKIVCILDIDLFEYTLKKNTVMLFGFFVSS